MQNKKRQINSGENDVRKEEKIHSGIEENPDERRSRKKKLILKAKYG